jgi:cytosine/adenosine deaminase-related metal-dependent hydrolase
MKNLILLCAVALGLAGCVNLHVHFPQAPAETAPQDKAGGEAR